MTGSWRGAESMGKAKSFVEGGVGPFELRRSRRERAISLESGANSGSEVPHVLRVAVILSRGRRHPLGGRQLRRKGDRHGVVERGRLVSLRRRIGGAWRWSRWLLIRHGVLNHRLLQLLFGVSTSSLASLGFLSTLISPLSALLLLESRGLSICRLNRAELVSSLLLVVAAIGSGSPGSLPGVSEYLVKVLNIH